jgi:hypothetical protein
MKARTIFVVVLLLFTAGCTSTFVYNRLDTLVAWYLEGLVTLTNPQRTELRQWLGETLEWHRDTELSRYAEFLRALSAKSTEPVTRIELEDAERQFRRFTRDLAERSAPQAAQLLLDLDDQQLDEMLHSLEEKSLERLEEEAELVDDGEWHSHRAKQIAKQMKRWTGRVETEQLELIRGTAKQLQPSYPDWLESQRTWRTALRDAMALRHNDVDAARREVVALLTEPDQRWTAKYRATQAHNRELTMDLLETLGKDLTTEQRSELQRQTLKLAERLEGLARGGET